MAPRSGGTAGHRSGVHVSALRGVHLELEGDPVLAAAFRDAAWTGPPPWVVLRHRLAAAVVSGTVLLGALLVAAPGERPCPVPPASSGRTRPVGCPSAGNAEAPDARTATSVSRRGSGPSAAPTGGVQPSSAHPSRGSAAPTG